MPQSLYQSLTNNLETLLNEISAANYLNDNSWEWYRNRMEPARLGDWKSQKELKTYGHGDHTHTAIRIWGTSLGVSAYVKKHNPFSDEVGSYPTGLNIDIVMDVDDTAGWKSRIDAWKDYLEGLRPDIERFNTEAEAPRKIREAYASRLERIRRSQEVAASLVYAETTILIVLAQSKRPMSTSEIVTVAKHRHKHPDTTTEESKLLCSIVTLATYGYIGAEFGETDEPTCTINQSGLDLVSDFATNPSFTAEEMAVLEAAETITDGRFQSGKVAIAVAYTISEFKLDLGATELAAKSLMASGHLEFRKTA